MIPPPTPDFYEYDEDFHPPSSKRKKDRRNNRRRMKKNLQDWLEDDIEELPDEEDTWEKFYGR